MLLRYSRILLAIGMLLLAGSFILPRLITTLPDFVKGFLRGAGLVLMIGAWAGGRLQNYRNGQKDPPF